MIVVLMDGSSQSIFDWYHRAVDLMASQGSKNVLEARKGNDFHFISQKLNHGFLAECSQCTLKSNPLFFHGLPVLGWPFLRTVWPPSQRRTPGAGRFSRSSTRSTLWSTISRMVLGWL